MGLEIEAKTVCTLGRHWTAEPDSSLILLNLEGNVGVGGMPAFEQLRIKINKMKRWGASRRGVERGQAESRRATLPQRGAAVHVSPRLSAEAFKMLLGATEAWLHQASQPRLSYQGAEAWGQSGTEARLTPVLSLSRATSFRAD